MRALSTVLIFSRFFPPMFDVGGKRAYRFARYLPEFGWRAAIVTDRFPEANRADPSAGLPLSSVHRIDHSYYPESWKRPGAADSDGTQQTTTKERKIPPDGLWARAQWHVRFPVGKELLLTPRAAQLAKRIAREENADVIFATSSPYAALLYGAAAKSLTGLPLHLDLRDPWSMNFLQRTKSPFTRQAEARMEHMVLGRADRVTLTCESAATAYRQKYPEFADKIAHIYNSFDPAQKPTDVAPRTGPVKLVHFGNCYGIRRLETVVRAIAKLRDQTGIEPTRLQMINLGRMAELDVVLMRQLGVEAFFESRPFVPYQEGLELLANADLQLLLSYGTEQLFVPAKLYDYLLSGAPILCIAPDSELTDIVRRTASGRDVRPLDIDGTVDAIRFALRCRADGTAFSNPDAAAIEAFSARRTAEQLAHSLDALKRR